MTRPDKNPWTREQRRRLRERREAGASFEEIALEVGHSPQSCKHAATQLGIVVRAARPWTAIEDASIHIWRRDGLSPEEIGARINRSPAAVSGRLAKLRNPTRLAFARSMEVRQRACMCCRRTFRSEGPHHRLCASCRGISVSPFEP